jgi:hypothetical protein
MDLLFLLLFPSGIGPAEEALRVLRPLPPATHEKTEASQPSPLPLGEG